MSRTLLILSIGPVQQFIGQSRRMRDLWFGSHLLSELARAAARDLAEIQDDRWTLVFPALDAGDPALLPCDGTTADDGSQPLGISNKIVAYRESISDEQVVAAVRGARAAVVERWRAFARHARDRAGELLADGLGEHERPEEVIESFLELVAGWSRFEADDDFDQARQEAEQAVAARKVLRDFGPWEGRHERKSSLDGQRESILINRRADNGRAPSKIERRLRLSSREHLDGIGFVKRAAGRPEQFVPVARIAIEPWLQAIDNAAKADKRLHNIFSSLEAACGDHQVPRCQRGVTRWLRGAFPYDGEIFFEGQWSALGKELGLDGFCERYVKPLFRTPLSLPEPHPYVAALHADGDRMGQMLASLHTPEAQRRLSAALAEFSRKVRGIVEAHFGLHVYAGGDDLVAFLPVDHAVPCADALQSAFVDTIHPELTEAPDSSSGDPLPTLSVGIGIAHFLTPLGQVLGRAREAEKYAKRGEGLRDGDPAQRNALGVVLDKRSGGTTRWRAQWDEDPPPVHRLAALKRMLVDGEMPSKLPYELRPVLDALNECRDDDRAVARTWALECRRILARKRGDGDRDGLAPADVGLELPVGRDTDVKALRDTLGAWIGAATVSRAWADAERNRRKVVERCAEQEGQDDD